MIEKPERIIGKTYTLFGNDNLTNEFFNFIDSILNRLLREYKDMNLLLDVIRGSSKRIKNYKRLISENNFLKESESFFRIYTPGIQEHLKRLPLLKFRESVMRLKEWQYHMYMLEYALVNRINRDRFLECDVKIALLPHCLRDLTKKCKASHNGLDYQCKHCSKNCFINEATKILDENGIIPYIWMSANLRSIARKNLSGKKSLGILGIACIPELINGMRSCARKGITAIGIPLDANRCIRWMGDFNPNSINLEMLKALLKH